MTRNLSRDECWNILNLKLAHRCAAETITEEEMEWILDQAMLADTAEEIRHIAAVNGVPIDDGDEAYDSSGEHSCW